MELQEIRVQSDDIITVPAAAKLLGRPKMTLYRWIDAGKVISIRLGGILFIPKSEIDRLNNSNENRKTTALPDGLT